MLLLLTEVVVLSVFVAGLAVIILLLQLTISGSKKLMKTNRRKNSYSQAAKVAFKKGPTRVLWLPVVKTTAQRYASPCKEGKRP